MESARSRWNPAWLLGLLAAVVLAGIVWQAVILKEQERSVRRLKRDTDRTAQAVSALSVLVQHRLDSLEQSLSALRAEVQGEAREPGRAVYMALRLRAIRAQAAQLPHDGVLLFGDSIVEALAMPEVCGLPTFNAAVGGVGAVSVALYAQELLPVAQPSVVVIGVGVNDAARVVTKRGDPSLAEWKRRYADILRDIHTVQATPVVLNLLPVEKARPLASQFDSQRMAQMNGELRRLAGQVGAIYVDTAPVFADASGFMKVGGTVDGVHLTSDSYALLTRALRQGVAEALKRRGQPCPAHRG